MKYKLIILDIDGTITTHVSSWQYIHERLGIWDSTARRYQEEFLAGKISYKRFCELDAAHWKGLSENNIRRIFSGIPYSRNAVSSLKRLKKIGFKLAAISTGLQFLAERIKEELKFDYVLSNRLSARNGILTGKVRINIEHGAKGEVVRAILKRFGIKPHEAIGIGDTDGDIPLARTCGYSIAFNSSSEKFSAMVDYACKTKDFAEAYRHIMEEVGYEKTGDDTCCHSGVRGRSSLRKGHARKSRRNWRG